MSTARSGVEPLEHASPHRRVREELRDGLAVIAFSAAASCTLAVVALLLTRLGS